ncbi:hypothetical protein HPB50_005576 [Hyalomma asiaticum]|uniref:Uncharacterized protein n=1 Tax=Hyalomma asiaticum TaxID=266040 RepID=A0ACB7SKD1_HYAAI|nr:hypothetical protein HPB50_005576 [Hyalomma asiaticum]
MDKRLTQCLNRTILQRSFCDFVVFLALKYHQGDSSLHCPTDDAFLVKFLRARKYNTQAAFENIKKYFKVRTEHPEMFKDLTPSRIPFDAACRKHRLITVSRQKDPMGRMAVLLKTGAWNTDICSLNDFFRVVLVIFEHYIHCEDSLERGVVVILDLKGLNFYHVAHYAPSSIRTVIKPLKHLFHDCMPLRLKGIYVINNPPIFDLLFGIAENFLKAKLVRRIRLFGYDLEELRQIMPDDVIPKEHGGTNESYDYGPLERELESEEDYYQKLGSYGYRNTPKTSVPGSNGLLTREKTLREEYVRL